MEKKQCTVIGCDEYIAYKGLCIPHSVKQLDYELEHPPEPPKPKAELCKVEGCDRPNAWRDLCRQHGVLDREGKPLIPFKPYTKQRGECKFDGCEREKDTGGYCHSHYEQLRSGRELKKLRPKKKRRVSPYINDSGYRVIRMNGANVLEHRYIMEQSLDRKLLPKENVHHINGIRDDNRISNLELWSVSQPAGQRVEDKIKWAKEFLDQYGYTISGRDT